MHHLGPNVTSTVAQNAAFGIGSYRETNDFEVWQLLHKSDLIVYSAGILRTLLDSKPKQRPHLCSNFFFKERNAEPKKRGAMLQKLKNTYLPLFL